ncbi:MAG: hypothetical protein Q4P20_12635 [Eubacteriales bacterium]|nr:hypothetical protein [Eubacteriales bacterium]
MLIDIHTHILPGIDDGAADETIAFQMLKRAYEEGTGILVATPHYHCHMGGSWEEKRQAAYDRVCHMAAEISPDLQILLGAELFYESGLLEDLKSGKYLTLNHTHAILVEFPLDVRYLYIKNAILSLQSIGYSPVLAHVERYSALANVDRVEELADMGVKIQVNADSVTGKNGWRLKKRMMQLMREDLIDLVATDTHDLIRRPPGMQSCEKYLNRKMSSDYCKKVCQDNALKLLFCEARNKYNLLPIGKVNVNL